MLQVVTSASTGTPATATGSIIVWVGLVIALLVVGALVIKSVRARFLNQEQDRNLSGFSLEDLREMRAEGKLSVEEYEAARGIILADTLTDRTNTEGKGEETQADTKRPK